MKAAAAIACVALVAAVGLDAQRRAPQPPRQRNKAAITVEAVVLAADRIRADRWYPEGATFEAARALSRAADMDLLVLASESERPDLRRIAVREFGRFETVSANYEAQFVNEIQQQSPMRMEAGTALVDLLWNRRGRPALPQTVQSLRQWFLLGLGVRDGRVVIGDTTIGFAQTFLEALHAAGVDDDYVLERAESAINSEIKFRAIEMANPFNPRHREQLERLASGTDRSMRDPAILRLLSNRDVPLCDLLAWAGPNIEPAIVKALAASKDAAVSGCGDWSPTRALLSRAETLREAPGPRAWQGPMLALLVADSHPNVRADALRSLSTLGYPLTTALAVTALDDKDYHLVRTAATLLEGAPDPVRLLPVFVTTFERLTTERKDTSREPRLTLLTRIREFALRSKLNGPDWAVTMQPHLEDVDPVIAEAVAHVIFEVTGTSHMPRPKHRPAEQPTENDLRTSPGCVVVQFDHADPWSLTLHRDRAPLTVARFWKLAVNGHYDGQDITHADDVVALTGSPGGNEFVSADRFIRDEVGAPVRAGSMVMLGHGRDTLDGRLQHVRREQRDRDRRDTVIGWARPVRADLSASNPIVQPPLPGNRIQSIVKCPEL